MGDDKPTPADAWVQLGLRPTRAENHATWRETMGRMRGEGMTSFRITVLEKYGVSVVEGWKVRPTNPAPVEPALVRAPDSTDPAATRATGPSE